MVDGLVGRSVFVWAESMVDQLVATRVVQKDFWSVGMLVDLLDCVLVELMVYLLVDMMVELTAALKELALVDLTDASMVVS